MEEFNERRRFRPYVKLFFKELIDDFPTEKKAMSKIKADIIDFIIYCYKRISDKGYVEEEMVEEMQNIAIILRAYCEVEDGRLWSEFYLFYIKFLEYLLREGQKYDKNLVIELLARSGILTSLSKYILQYKSYIFDINLILNYFDISVETRNINMLSFMTNQICSQVKEIKKINFEDLTIEELVEAIRLGYFNDKREELGKYLKGLLISFKENDKEKYDDLRIKLLKLHIMEDLDIWLFKELLCDHVLYELMYFPWKVDFKEIRIELFIGLKNVKILDSVIRYGGYDFYLRVQRAKKKDKKIGNVYIFKNVLKHDDFKRRLYEKMVAKKERRRNRRSVKGSIEIIGSF